MTDSNTISTINSTNTSNTSDNSLSNEQALANKSLIIFDWDGTLMDSIGLIVESMHQAGQASDYTVTDEAIKDIIGLSLVKGIDLVYPQASDDEKKAIEQSYGKYYVDASMQPNSPHSKFFDGIEPMLKQLLAEAKQLAVATGKKRVGLDRLLDISKSRDYFVSTRGADESGSKPNPQMLKDILQETGKQIDDAVFIGDSIHDIQMANALGMMSIAVEYGAGSASSLAKSNPTFQVKTPQELAQLLTKS